MYADPISAKPQWSVIDAPGGGIMGVYSLSQARPIKTGAFAARDSTLAGTARYSDWHLSYVPRNPLSAS